MMMMMMMMVNPFSLGDDGWHSLSCKSWSSWIFGGFLAFFFPFSSEIAEVNIKDTKFCSPFCRIQNEFLKKILAFLNSQLWGIESLHCLVKRGAITIFIQRNNYHQISSNIITFFAIFIFLFTFPQLPTLLQNMQTQS